MEDHLAKALHLSMKNFRVKGSSFDASTDRKTSLLRDRPARRAVKRAYRIWVSDAAHHCVQLRIDLLFTMSYNLRRGDLAIAAMRIRNSWTNFNGSRGFRAPQISNRRSTRIWWSQTGSNRRPPACKAGALPTELWPRQCTPAFAKDSAGNLRSIVACQPKLRSSEGWWAWEDSNFRPHAYQARALTN